VVGSSASRAGHHAEQGRRIGDRFVSSGPAVSWLCAIGTMPERLSRPSVGLMPTRPFMLAATRSSHRSRSRLPPRRDSPRPLRRSRSWTPRIAVERVRILRLPAATAPATRGMRSIRKFAHSLRFVFAEESRRPRRRADRRRVCWRLANRTPYQRPVRAHRDPRQDEPERVGELSIDAFLDG